MKATCISLPNAVLGREYIIDDIKIDETAANDYSGYGLLAGSKIKKIFTAPSKDPCAYEVMGAVLALRREDSEMIMIRRCFNE